MSWADRIVREVTAKATLRRWLREHSEVANRCERALFTIDNDQLPPDARKIVQNVRAQLMLIVINQMEQNDSQ